LVPFVPVQPSAREAEVGRRQSFERVKALKAVTLSRFV
jgi:hypothetical protein